MNINVIPRKKTKKILNKIWQVNQKKHMRSQEAKHSQNNFKERGTLSLLDSKITGHLGKLEDLLWHRENSSLTEYRN